jgi:glycine/D-amino acid oxidase-like deaminating enzyme/nitrite reductase/ring-hydroxylating ferredoxin subunit
MFTDCCMTAFAEKARISLSHGSLFVKKKQTITITFNPITMERPKMTNEAVWSSSDFSASYPSLTGDIQAEVAIIGAGITGLSTAYHLCKAGKKVVILEQSQVGKGTTGSSTGNLYAPIDERLSSILSKHGENTLRLVAESRMAAVDFIEQRVREFNIDCEFQRVPWHLFTTPTTKDQKPEVEKETEAAAKAGLALSKNTPPSFPFPVDTLLSLEGQAQFNPLKYVQQLAAALASEHCVIFENTQVTGVEDGQPCLVQTPHGTVTADHVVMATHSPKGIYGVHTAMESYREYVMAVRLRGELPLPGIYWHVQSGPQYSVRPYREQDNNYLLVLGEPYKVGSKSQHEELLAQLEKYLRDHFDVEQIEYIWAAQNYKAADNLPYIGTSLMESKTYIATGFSADGLTYGTLAGRIISDAILGKENPWAKIYDPKRFTPIASAKKFAKENITVASHLLKDYLFYGEADEVNEIQKGEGKTIKIDGDHLAAYRDEAGMLHIVSGICTHMGCVVHWNDGEKSWDCPCHGSRFSIDGKVLEGPAYTHLAKPGEPTSYE